MSREQKPAASRPSGRRKLSQRVAEKEQRKLRARRERDRSIWFGLGMFGLVGWSIAVPTLLGIAVGIWIDRTWHPPYSATLMCLFIGVVTGCAIAWYWVKNEGSAAAEKDSGVRQASEEEQRGEPR